MTTGARELPRRGTSSPIQGVYVLRSVSRPTNPGPPVAGIERCRRGGWGSIIEAAKPSREKTASGVFPQESWFAARRPPPSRGRSHHGAQNAKRIAVLVALRRSRLDGCARTSLFFRLQKSVGDHCRLHRSSPTGPKRPGRPRGGRGVNGGLVRGSETSSSTRNRDGGGAEGETGVARVRPSRGSCHVGRVPRPVEAHSRA